MYALRPTASASRSSHKDKPRPVWAMS